MNLIKRLIKSWFITVLFCITLFLLLSIITRQPINNYLMVMTSMIISLITSPLMLKWLAPKKD